MSGPGGPDAAEAGQYRAPAGLLEKLMAAVRPEFRAEVLTSTRETRVFGGPPCAVTGCERPAPHQEPVPVRTGSGGIRPASPDLAEFTATTEPGLGRSPAAAACAVPGCNYCHARAACASGTTAVARAGRPASAAGWRPGSRRCRPHRRRMPAGRPAAACGPMPTHAVLPYPLRRAGGVPAARARRVRRGPRRSRPRPCERIDLRRLPGRLRLEIQYVLQCRGDERQSRLRPGRCSSSCGSWPPRAAASLLDRTEE